MSIDEMIEKLRLECEEQKNTVEYLKKQDDKKCYIVPHRQASLDCEQLAEWLEELKKLRAENAHLYCEIQAIGATMGMFEKEIRNQAIKEFAKRLKEMYPIMENDLFIVNDVLQRTIDKIVEEMGGAE